jgi:hypothetical protein
MKRVLTATALTIFGCAGDGLRMRIQRRLGGVCGSACTAGIGPGRQQGPCAYGSAGACAKGGEADS